MNKNKFQSGSAHLIIIIILGLALIGSLGFVFYQNFIQNKDNTLKISDEDKNTTPTVAQSTSTVANAGYLVLDDWNVKFKLPTDLGDNVITHQKSTDSSGVEYYKFSTERISVLGGECTSLNQLYRTTEPTDVVASGPVLAGKFGGYYYYASQRQEGCMESTTGDTTTNNLQFQDINMLKTLLTSVEAK